jgi:hypothetical protein
MKSASSIKDQLQACGMFGASKQEDAGIAFGYSAGGISKASAFWRRSAGEAAFATYHAFKERHYVAALRKRILLTLSGVEQPVHKISAFLILKCVLQTAFDT